MKQHTIYHTKGYMNFMTELKIAFNNFLAMLGFHITQAVNAFESKTEVANVSVVDHLTNSVKLCRNVDPYTLIKLDGEIETTIPTMHAYLNYLYDSQWALTSGNMTTINKTCLGREVMAMVSLSSFLSQNDRFTGLAEAWNTFLQRIDDFVEAYNNQLKLDPTVYNIRMSDIIIADLTDILNRILFYTDNILTD